MTTYQGDDNYAYFGCELNGALSAVVGATLLFSEATDSAGDVQHCLLYCYSGSGRGVGSWSLAIVTGNGLGTL